MFLLQSPTSGYAGAFVYPHDLLLHKLRGFHHLFLNYNVGFDRLTFVILAGAFLLGLLSGRIRIHPHVRWTLVLLLTAYLLMPETLFGTGLADYRLPVGFALILIAGSELGPARLPIRSWRPPLCWSCSWSGPGLWPNAGSGSRASIGAFRRPSSPCPKAAPW